MSYLLLSIEKALNIYDCKFIHVLAFEIEAFARYNQAIYIYKYYINYTAHKGITLAIVTAMKFYQSQIW